jgi:hypothetical protein
MSEGFSCDAGKRDSQRRIATKKSALVLSQVVVTDTGATGALYLSNLEDRQRGSFSGNQARGNSRALKPSRGLEPNQCVLLQ